MYRLTVLTECTVKLHLELIKTKAVDLVTDLKVFRACLMTVRIQYVYNNFVLVHYAG